MASLAIVILSLLALFLIFTEFAVLIIISYFAHKRQKVKLRPILYKTVTYLPTLFTYCLPGFILYAVVLLPLLNMGYETALIPQIQILTLLQENCLRQRWDKLVITRSLL